jgi:hypothetical protein
MIKINKNRHSACCCRGGSWLSDGYNCETLYQNDGYIYYGGYNIGFRIFRTTKEM